MRPLRDSTTIFLAIVVAALLVQSTLAILFGWVGDDAYIAFRYARNLAEGVGLRFNPSEEPPTEGYTQLGWVLIAAAVERLGLPVVATTRAIEIATGLVLLVLVARRARERGGIIAALAAASFFATSPGVVIWSSGGLGTLLFATTIFLVIDRAIGDNDRWRVFAVAAAAIAVTLVRFDGVWFVGWALLALFAAGAKTHSRSLRRVAVAAGVVTLIAVAAQTAWRLGYHGDWLPNTARAKANLEPWVLGRGLSYVLSNFANVPAVAITAVAAVALGLRRRTASTDAWSTSAAIVVVGTLVYCVAVGGDFMAMGRFMVPALPFLAVTVGDLAAAVARRKGVGPAIAVAGALVCGSLPTLFGATYLPESARRAIEFRHGLPYETELEYLSAARNRAEHWSELGRALALHTDPKESLVFATIGAVGYFSRLTVFDRFGLVDREVALHWPRDPERRAPPGHDVFADVTFFADRNPTYVVATIEYGLVEGTPKYDEALAHPYYSTGKVLLFPLHKAEGFKDDGTLILLRY